MPSEVLTNEELTEVVMALVDAQEQSVELELLASTAINQIRGRLDLLEKWAKLIDEKIADRVV